MPTYCCVPSCTNKIGGHLFPKDTQMKKKWSTAIKRYDTLTKTLWKPKSTSVVCREHFIPEDYNKTLLGVCSRLKRNAIPSVFKFKKPESTSNKNRADRAHKREVKKVTEASSNSTVQEFIGEEVIIRTSDVESVEGGDNILKDDKHDQEIQCDLLTDSGTQFSVCEFKSNPVMISYYTGFEDYEHFMYVFTLLEIPARNLDYKCKHLSVENHFFLTLMKLRQAKDDQELAYFFKISQPVVSKIFHTWLRFLYYQLDEINFWPSQETNNNYMPDDFKRLFPSTRVILDTTETPIQKPSNVKNQSATFSTYKNRNTLKTLVGCTPRGLISFVSDSYGGSASDRQIIERSQLIKNSSKYFSKKDSIMANRGIMVQDLFARMDVQVNTPSLLNGKSQLDEKVVVKDRRIASKRIHIERVIGLAKTYKMLKKELSGEKIISRRNNC
ncbi:Uncharacterised protein r2_g4268 [Pycnogonum litorale]